MKSTLRKVLCLALCFLFGAVIILSSASTVYAMDYNMDNGMIFDKTEGNEDGGYDEKTVRLAVDGIRINSKEISYDEVYSIAVRIEGAAVSSFSFEICMPWFVTVDYIEFSTELTCIENALYESNVYDEGRRVYAAYSSTYEQSDITVMQIRFRVNTTETLMETPYFNETIFTNVKAEHLDTMVEVGMIEIYKEAEAIIMGDADLNGTVTLSDVMTIMRYIVRTDSNFTYEQHERADVDRNGNVDIIDCQYIQNYLAGLIPSLDDINKNEGCNHYNSREIDRNDPTCVMPGFVEYHCYDCDESYTETLYPTGNHQYDEGGSCVNCGAPMDAEGGEIIYQTEMNGRIYVLYKDGRCECTWEERTAEGMVIARKEEGMWKKTENGYNVIINGESLMIEAPVTDECNHERRVELNRFDASCIASGFVEYHCYDCGESFTETLHPTGKHTLNESGYCEGCGEYFGGNREIEISIEGAIEIGNGLNVFVLGKETYTITGTVTEDQKYGSGYYCIEDDKGISIIILPTEEQYVPLKVGDTVTLRGIPVRAVVGTENIAAVTNVEILDKAEDCISIEEFKNITLALYGATATTPEVYSVSGTISSIVNYTYGNLYITDESGNSLYIYGLYDAEGNRFDAIANQPLVNDEITVTGSISKYIDNNGRIVIEIKNATLVSSSNSDNKITIEEANTIGSSLNITVEEEYPTIVGGTVFSIENPAYGSMYLVDENGNKLFIYGFKDPSAVKAVKEGQYITVMGYGVKYYNAKERTVVIEMKNAELITEISEDMIISSIADFNATVSALSGTNQTATEYEITGTVSEIKNATYGNLYITDEYGNTLYIYGLYDEFGTRYDAMDICPKEGDTITIKGVITSYISSSNEIVIEIKSATLVSIDEGKVDVVFPTVGY